MTTTTARMAAMFYPPKGAKPGADTTLTARYDGGSYIHLYFQGDDKAFDAINVWDYELNKPQIENTQSAVWQQLRDWIDRLDDGDLTKHYENRRVS